MNPKTDTNSQFLPPPDRIRFDDEANETTNRGAPVDTMPSASQRHATRQRQEDDWAAYCFRANVLIHGYDKACAMRRIAEEGDV